MEIFRNCSQRKPENKCEKYRGWSLKDIENVRKLMCWEQHWKKLFILKEGDSPKTATSVEETVPKAYKTRLKVYQLRKDYLINKLLMRLDRSMVQRNGRKILRHDR